MDEGDRERVRVGVTMRKDQHRWCKQQGLDVNGGLSAVVRAAIDYYRQAVHLTAAHDQEEARP